MVSTELIAIFLGVYGLISGPLKRDHNIIANNEFAPVAMAA